MANPNTSILNQKSAYFQWVLLAGSATDIPRPRAIICTATGNITMEDAFATALTLTAPTVNQIMDLAPVKVTAVTGTFYALY